MMRDRWLAICYQAGILGVALYERITNEASPFMGTEASTWGRSAACVRGTAACK